MYTNYKYWKNINYLNYEIEFIIIITDWKI